MIPSSRYLVKHDAMHSADTEVGKLQSYDMI